MFRRAQLDRFSQFSFSTKAHDLAGRHVLLLPHAFENLSSEERSRIIDNLAPGVDMKLLALSGFIAEAAINTRNAALIKAGPILILLENFRKDYRENIRYLVLIAFAANELGINLPFVINSILHIASDQAKQHLVNFSCRDPELNKLSSFGVKGEMSGGYFQFSRL